MSRLKVMEVVGERRIFSWEMLKLLQRSTGPLWNRIERLVPDVPNLPLQRTKRWSMDDGI